MADDAKKAILATNTGILDAFNKLDFEGAMKFYTKDAILLAEGLPPRHGHEEILETFKKVIPKVINMVAGECFYFELINDDTAYMNEYISSIDNEGITRKLFKDGLLWKKIDGRWYLHIDMFNSCPLP